MEKNKHILDNALGKLPCFSPNDAIWKNIEVQLLHQPLSESLKQLPNYNPPESVWDPISLELSKQEKIKQLSQFTPEDSIWQGIESDLDKRIRIKKFRLAGLISTAAAILILGYFIITSVFHDKNISYSEELIEIKGSNLWQDNGAEVEHVLIELCKTNPTACTSPLFIEKEKELNYLNEQKQEILKRMNAWDENEDLQLILTKIELEKNEIIKHK